MNAPSSLVRGWHLGLYNTLCHLPWKTTEQTDIMHHLGKYGEAVRFPLKYPSCLHEMKIQTAYISIFQYAFAEQLYCEMLTRGGIFIYKAIRI